MSGKTSIVLQLANSEYVLSRIVKGDGTIEYQGREIDRSHLPIGDTEFLTKDEYEELLNRIPVAKRDNYVKTTYVRLFNDAGGYELKDAQQVTILDYHIYSGMIALRLEDGRIVNDVVSTRIVTRNDDDLPENWVAFTTINPY